MKKFKGDIEDIVRQKTAQIPSVVSPGRDGMTPEQMAEELRRAQQSTLTEKSIDDFLKIIKLNDLDVLERFVSIDEDLEEDLYDYDVIYEFFLSVYIKEPEILKLYDDFRKGVLRRTLSRSGRGFLGFENVAAGRTAADVGLFRGIFNAMTHRLFNKEEIKR